MDSARSSSTTGEDENPMGSEGGGGAGSIDTVASEVNPFLVLDAKIQPLHNPFNVVAKLQFSLPKSLQGHQRSWANNAAGEGAISGEPIRVDADGDLDVPRSSSAENQRFPDDDDQTFILIEHMNSTTLDLVGHQIWRGAFILSDFILMTAPKYFGGKNVLELGSGTGFSSIVASLVASKLIITDRNDENVLGLIQANLRHNSAWVKSECRVKPLDFLNPDWSTELEELVADTDVIIAADVVYHHKITDGFVLTLQKCLSTGKPKDIFIALEKRFVFTLSDLDIVAPAYDHFLEEMERVLGLVAKSTPPGQRSTLDSTSRSPIFQLVDLSEFPLHFNYEPSKDLVLWHIRTKQEQKFN